MEVVLSQFTAVVSAGDLAHSTRRPNFAGRLYSDSHGMGDDLWGESVDDKLQGRAGLIEHVRLGLLT